MIEKDERERKLEGPLIGAPDARKPNLEKLPSNCLQKILSFVTYEKVSHIRQVCKVFNEIAKKCLGVGQGELELRLQREIERADRRILYPTSVRSSYDMLRFLISLQEAIKNCTLTYSFYTNYFVAGKLLDDANCLLKIFNSSTVVPYFQEHAHDQKPNPFLGLIVENSERAYAHFATKILWRFYFDNNWAEFKREFQYDLEWDTLCLQNYTHMMKRNELKIRKRKMDCGNQMRKEFLKSIRQLNENVLDLMQQANKMNKELERVIKRMDMGQNNCLFPLTTSSQLREAGLAELRAGSKRPNLATLPSTCVKNIVSYFNSDEMAQLRIVCKSFNEVCKKQLNRKFEKLIHKIEFEIKLYNLYSAVKVNYLEPNMMQDVCSFLLLCKENYKWHLGSNYYFAAGKIFKQLFKVLDEAQRKFNELDFTDDDHLHDDLSYYEYKCQPHYSLFYLMDLVHKAIAHFKLTVVPKYFPSALNCIYVPDFITGDVMHFEDESQSKLELEKLMGETDVKIKEQNDKNRNVLSIISGLKKKILILNKEISKTINVLE